MTEQNHLRTPSDGIPARGSRQNLNVISAVVIGLALIWVIFCGFVFWNNPPVSTETALVFAGAAILPAAILGICALTMQKLQISQQDAQRLHTAVEALRHSFIEQNKTNDQASLEASVSRKLTEIAEEQRKIHSLLSQFPRHKQMAREGRQDQQVMSAPKRTPMTKPCWNLEHRLKPLQRLCPTPILFGH